MLLVSTRVLTISSNSPQEFKLRGIPVRGKLRNTMLRYDLRPVFRPSQKGELVERHSRCGIM